MKTYQLDMTKENGDETSARYHNLKRAESAFALAVDNASLVCVMLWDITGGEQNGIDGFWR